MTTCWCWQLSEGHLQLKKISEKKKKEKKPQGSEIFVLFRPTHTSPRYNMLYNWICLCIIYSQQTCFEEDTDRQTDLTCTYFHLYETQRLTDGAIWPRHADYIHLLQHTSLWNLQRANSTGVVIKCNTINITLANNQLHAQFLYFIISLLQSSTCFEQRSCSSSRGQIVLVQHLV